MHIFCFDPQTRRLQDLGRVGFGNGPDLYQIVEGEPGVFYIGARGHLLEYHLKDTPHYY